MLDMEPVIKLLQWEQTHKYLGINVDSSIQNASMKEEISDKCYKTAETVLKSKLNAHKALSINSLAILVINSLTVLNWNIIEIKEIYK